MGARLFLAWMALILLAHGLFHAKASYETKRRWHVLVYVALWVSLFAPLVYRNPGWAVVLVPSVGLLGYERYARTRFCVWCGATNYRGWSASGGRKCKRCGRNLDSPVPPTPESSRPTHNG